AQKTILVALKSFKQKKKRSLVQKRKKNKNPKNEKQKKMSVLKRARDVEGVKSQHQDKKVRAVVESKVAVVDQAEPVFYVIGSEARRGESAPEFVGVLPDVTEWSQLVGNREVIESVCDSIVTVMTLERDERERCVREEEML